MASDHPQRPLLIPALPGARGSPRQSCHRRRWQRSSCPAWGWEQSPGQCRGLLMDCISVGLHSKTPTKLSRLMAALWGFWGRDKQKPQRPDHAGTAWHVPQHTLAWACRCCGTEAAVTPGPGAANSMTWRGVAPGAGGCSYRTVMVVGWQWPLLQQCGLSWALPQGAPRESRWCQGARTHPDTAAESPP